MKADCFVLADEREAEVLRITARKMKARGDGGLARVQRFTSKRKTKTATATSSGNKRSDKLLLRFQSEGIDLSALRNGLNPFDVERHNLHYWMADFVMKDVPFKPKDVTEHVQAHAQTDLTTGSIKTEVARFSSALVEAGILERKELYILCLVR